MGGLIGNDFFSGQIFDINPITGAASGLRGSGATFLAGVVFGSGGTLYGLTMSLSSVPNSLVTINQGTGVSTLVGATGLGAIREGDIAFDPSTGALYGMQDQPLNSLNLFRIDPLTGVATTIGPLGTVVGPPVDFSAMAFNAAGTLFIIDTSADVLLTVDKSTAAILTTTSLSVNLGGLAGMAFDPVTGIAYVADGGPGTNSLYTLNTSNGVLSLVGAMGAPNGAAGLSFTPSAIPEPSTIGLVLFGFVVLAVRSTVGLRQRKQSRVV
jgi:DNA-binding beta-propeller fold protein YncE